MRKIITLPALLLMCACTISQQNGNEVRLKPPPLFADQTWEITGKEVAANGERVCTVSAGEIDVTWRGKGSSAESQVAVSDHMNIGDRYKILVAGHYYETADGAFDPEQSGDIINDFMHSDIAYTELQSLMIELNGQQYRRATNNIPLRSFTPAYNACMRYMDNK